MTDFFKFASEHPWLTFFLAMIVSEMLVRCVYYPVRYLAVMIRGWEPYSEKKEEDEDADNKD
jgi:hypothetical protein